MDNKAGHSRVVIKSTVPKSPMGHDVTARTLEPSLSVNFLPLTKDIEQITRVGGGDWHCV